MIQKLTTVVVVVKDQTKALDFYTRVLGFEKRTDVTPPGRARWVTVAPKGQEIEMALYQQGTPDPSGGGQKWEAGKGPTWTFLTNDCKKDFAEFKSKGVKFDQQAPGEYSWGITATFTDPDGNRFGLNQPPAKQAW